VEYHIDTGNNRPIRQPLRRNPFQHLKWIDKEVEEMRKHGIVEPAVSPWASNVVLVKKKDGTLRFCIDYRRLNSVTRQDSYPLPLIDNCLNAFSGSSWYSTLNLRSGYYNIPIAEKDRDKSAFVTRSDCYRFTVMPFGLTCATSVFQRLIDCVLCGLSYFTCFVYLDNVIVFGRSFEKQLYRLDEVFVRLRSTKLKLKPSKCSLFQRSVEFFGNVVSENGIAMQDEKIFAILDWPPCRNVTEVRSFMGLTGYYRSFVKDFSIIASPLYDLMKKKVTFCWTPQCQQAFDELKYRLMTGSILSLPKDDGTYILDTDACDTGLGAVLSQIQSGEERVIAYALRTMSAAERKYETTRKVLLAVVYRLKQFRQYLLNRHIVIRIDHAALSWLRRTPDPMPQLARWLTLIEQYDYEVAHCPGKRHGNVDGLSRKPDRRPLPDVEEKDEYDQELDELPPRKTRVILDVEDGVTASVGKILCRQQGDDPELGDVITMRIAEERPLSKEKLQTHTELTKKMVSKWEDLEIYNGLVYRRKKARTSESRILCSYCYRAHKWKRLYSNATPEQWPDISVFRRR